MKKIINEITLRCTEIVELPDKSVNCVVDRRRKLETHRDIADAIKAELGFDNVTVVDSQMFVTDGEKDALTEVTMLINSSDDIRFNVNLDEMTKTSLIAKNNLDIMLLVANLEKELAELRRK